MNSTHTDGKLSADDDNVGGASALGEGGVVGGEGEGGGSAYWLCHPGCCYRRHWLVYLLPVHGSVVLFISLLVWLFRGWLVNLMVVFL